MYEPVNPRVVTLAGWHGDHSQLSALRARRTDVPRNPDEVADDKSSARAVRRTDRGKALRRSTQSSFTSTAHNTIESRHAPRYRAAMGEPGRPAVRATDQHACPASDPSAHTGGPVVGPGALSVLISKQVAARATDMAACAGGVVDFIVTGAATVFIGGLPAARVLEHTMHGGSLVAGAATVLIGGPSVGATLGTPMHAAAFFPGRQQGNDTCALMTTQGILHQATGIQKTEVEMRAIGVASGAYTVGQGTTDEAALLNQVGIPATGVSSPSLQNIAQAIGESRAVIVAYDARPVWGVVSARPLGHAVRVTGVDYDANGAVSGVHINDTGSGVADQEVPAPQFNQAMSQFGGGRMATSNSPIL
jgi:uncharacterized Zn-binding protein involved in type VI secretion